MISDPAAPERTKLVGPLAFAALATVSGTVSLKKLHDPDLFWHLRQGAWLLDRGRIPFPDPFSDGAEIPWRGVDFGTDLLFALVERGFGLSALGVVVAAAAAAFGVLLFALALRVTKARGVALVAASLAVAASMFRFEPKSDLFTMLAVAAVCLLRERSAAERTPLSLLWSVPLVAAASLFHRGAFVLVPLLAATALGAALAREGERARIAALAALGSALSLVALWPTAAAGLGAFDLLTRASYAEIFAEWAPPKATFFTLQNLPFSALLALGVVGLALRRRLDERTLTGLLLALLGLRAVRFVPLAAIGLVPLALPALEVALGPLRARSALRRLAPLFAVAIPTILVGAQFVHRTPPGLVGFGVLEWRLPVDAADFLRRGAPAGRLYNAFLFGGYLMHAVPERRVFVDGRNDLAYTDAYFRESIESGHSPKKLLALADERGLDVLVVRAAKVEDPFVGALLEDRRFVLVHLDDIAAVVVRASAQPSAFVERYAYRELDPGRTLRALAEGPLSETLVAEVLRYRRDVPGSVRAHLYAGLLAGRFGDRDTAEEELGTARRLGAERGLELTD